MKNTKNYIRSKNSSGIPLINLNKKSIKTRTVKTLVMSTLISMTSNVSAKECKTQVRDTFCITKIVNNKKLKVCKEYKTCTSSLSIKDNKKRARWGFEGFEK